MKFVGMMATALAVVMLLIIVSVGIRACSTAGWFVSRSVEVAKQEVDPGELLRKYEWFKDAAATLDKKQADIAVYRMRISNMREDYFGTPRKDWPREDREQYNLWQSEVAGVQASFNAMASEYNAQMAKVNWRFTNIGQLPKGATVALPREYAPYITGDVK